MERLEQVGVASPQRNGQARHEAGDRGPLVNPGRSGARRKIYESREASARPTFIREQWRQVVETKIK